MLDTLYLLFFTPEGLQVVALAGIIALLALWIAILADHA